MTPLPSVVPAMAASVSALARTMLSYSLVPSEPHMYRRKLKLKAKLESSSSSLSFKRLLPGIDKGFIGSHATALPRPG